MTLRTATPRPGFVDAIRQRLSDLMGWPSGLLAQLDPLDVHLVVPHDVFTVRVAELLDGGLVRDARWIAQRYLLFDGDEAVASVELADADGTRFMVNEGPYVRETARRIRQAEHNPTLADAEVRVLRQAPLHVMALWLRTPAGADFYLPMAPAPGPLQRGVLRTAEQMSTALVQIARHQLDQPRYLEG